MLSPDTYVTGTATVKRKPDWGLGGLLSFRIRIIAAALAKWRTLVACSLWASIQSLLIACGLHSFQDPGRLEATCIKWTFSLAMYAMGSFGGEMRPQLQTCLLMALGPWERKETYANLIFCELIDLSGALQVP